MRRPRDAAIHGTARWTQQQKAQTQTATTMATSSGRSLVPPKRLELRVRRGTMSSLKGGGSARVNAKSHDRGKIPAAPIPTRLASTKDVHNIAAAACHRRASLGGLQSERINLVRPKPRVERPVQPARRVLECLPWVIQRMGGVTGKATASVSPHRAVTTHSPSRTNCNAPEYKKRTAPERAAGHRATQPPPR